MACRGRMRDCTIIRARHLGRAEVPWSAILRRGTIKGLVLAVHGLLLVYLWAPVQPRERHIVSPPAKRPATLQVELLAAPKQPIHPPAPRHRMQRAPSRPIAHADLVPRAHPHLPAAPSQRPATLSLTWQPVVATSTVTNIDQALAARRARFSAGSQRMADHLPTLPGQSCYRTAFHYVPENHKGLRGVLTVLQALTTPPELRKELAPKEYEPVACPHPPAAAGHRDASIPSPGD